MNVVFDESGNTGANLLDEDQYVFALASVCISEATAGEIMAVFDGRIQGEYKYTKLKKATRNHSLILDVLERDDVNSNSCKVFVIHKPFMAMTKIVDNIYEPIANEGGIDLYENRMALATANLLSTVLPVFLGATRYHRIISRFNEMARRKDEQSFRLFEAEVYAAYEFLGRRHRGNTDIFVSMVAACKKGLGFMRKHIVPLDHEPWIPAIYVLLHEWTKQAAERFVVVHDDLKVLAHERERIMKQANPLLKATTVTHYGTTVQYPLMVHDVTVSSSDEHKAIQLADFFAGAVCHALNGKAKGEKPTRIEEQIAEVLFRKRLVCGGLWPDKEVTPEGLGVEGEYGTNPLDYVTRIFGGDPSVYEQQNSVGA